MNHRESIVVESDMQPNGRRYGVGACFLVAVLAIGGCASVPLADRDADKAAKTFSVKPGLANIYVYRKKSVGDSLVVPVVLDGVTVGVTARKTFIVQQVHPGRHTLAAKTENISSLDVYTVAGGNYFVWLDLSMGNFKARSELHLMDDADGKKGVKKCRLIE